MWVPPRVSQALRRESQLARQRLAMLTDYHDTMRTFNDDLRRIDARLQLVKARETVTAGSGLRPGYWHIVRDNPGAPPSWFTLEGPDGEFVEPTSEVFERLVGWMDLQNPAVTRRRREREEAALKAQERHERDEHERRNLEVLERYQAGTRTRVSMSTLPWAQNAAGAKRPTRGSGRG